MLIGAVVAFIVLPATSADATTCATQNGDPPTVSTIAASNITKTSALLKANIDPNEDTTTYAFEYGPTTAYGSTSATRSLAATDNANHPVSISVTGLLPGRLYHYRIIATGIFEGTNYGTACGNDLTFTTDKPSLPVISGLSSPTGVGSAVIQATIQPDQEVVTVGVVYGVGPPTNTATPIGLPPVQVGPAASPVSFVIPNLNQGALYHFTISAQGLAGTRTGTYTFTTGRLTLSGPTGAVFFGDRATLGATVTSALTESVPVVFESALGASPFAPFATVPTARTSPTALRVAGLTFTARKPAIFRTSLTENGTTSTSGTFQLVIYPTVTASIRKIRTHVYAVKGNFHPHVPSVIKLKGHDRRGRRVVRTVKSNATQRFAAQVSGLSPGTYHVVVEPRQSGYGSSQTSLLVARR
jgi:hypothetical protein